MGQSLVQRSPIERDVSECDGEALTMRLPWPARGFCLMGKERNIYIYIQGYS